MLTNKIPCLILIFPLLNFLLYACFILSQSVSLFEIQSWNLFKANVVVVFFISHSSLQNQSCNIVNLKVVLVHLLQTNRFNKFVSTCESVTERMSWMKTYFNNRWTDKLVFNNRRRDPEKVVVVDRWSMSSDNYVHWNNCKTLLLQHCPPKWNKTVWRELAWSSVNKLFVSMKAVSKRINYST